VSLPSTIVGWGTAVPDGRVTNADLEARLDTSDTWIVERTGIRERRVAGADETTATLGTTAARGDQARRTHADRHRPPDRRDGDAGTTLPTPARFISDALGVSCGSFDVAAACAGSSTSW
jgi:3-oxoacyl-[acyl-carrier-protein] synthase-3